MLVALIGLAVAIAVVVTAVVWRPWRDDPAVGAEPAPASAPSGSPAASSSPAAEDALTGSLDGLVQASAPYTSPDGVDGANNATSYEADRMLDGDPETTWRMDGDGTGVTVTFTLDRARPINLLGLVNGFAKFDPVTGMDRYTQGRRITRATWSLGGYSYGVALNDGSRGIQEVEIPPITTDTVELQITAVTPPGDEQFDRTAISDVLIAYEVSGHE